MRKECCTFFTRLCLLSILTVALSTLGKAQVNNQPEIIRPVYHDTSIPLKDMQEAPLSPTPWTNGIIPLRQALPRGETHFVQGQSIQLNDGANANGTIIENFDGVSAQGYAPPDVSGDVGTNDYMMMVNSRFQIWDKNGNSLLGPYNLSTIWSGFPGPWASSLNDGDPIVRYDDQADRWLASEFSLPNYPYGPFYMLVAVSQTSDPTGSWYRYGYEFADMPDYPKLGVWSDGYYMSANRFASGSGNFVGTLVAAMERDSMLVGNSANIVSFLNSSSTWSLLPSDCDGVASPAGAPNYFLGTYSPFGSGNTNLDIYEFHVDWNTPANSTFTGPLLLTTPAFNMVNGIPQLGTGTLLDDLSDRPMQRLQYRNFGTHQSMVVCQSVNVGSGRSGIRWWELRKSSADWSIYQEGTYAPADGLSRWMGSIAMNANGDIALGYSVSGSTIYPEIRYTGRLDGDPLGEMTVAEDTIYSSSGAQTGLTRWGDYTTMSVDPDGQTFWYSNQYQPYQGSFNWKTRIASFAFTVTPVEFTSFNASVNNGSVAINWATATETNNKGFEIQRKSENGNYAKIGFINGAGTSAQPHTYSYVDSKLTAGKYIYRLKQVDLNGTYDYSKEVNVTVNVPLAFGLDQNYPNPFNPTTEINYTIAKDGYVSLTIFNTLGQEVTKLVDGVVTAGKHMVSFNASKLASGVYYYRLQQNSKVSVKKMMLLK